MKKSVKGLILIAAIVLITGCGKVAEKKEIVKVCKSTVNDVTNGYKLESEYKVFSKGDIVEKVETIETIISENEELLDYFDEKLEDTYETMQEIYGGYTNEVESDNGKVVSKTTIDYNVMDIKKYVEDNSAMKNYVNHENKILLQGILNIYEGLGAICE